MPNALIKELVPSFVISGDRSCGYELLVRGDEFESLKAEKIDIVIKSKAGIIWLVDKFLSKPIEFEGETFFLIRATCQKTTISETQVYDDLSISFGIQGKILAKKTLKVFYSNLDYA
jgi:hypothetical protein